MEDENIFLPANSKQTQKTIIKNFLTELLLAQIQEIACTTALENNLVYKNIRMNNNKTSWATCSSRGSLSFCWRLVFAPKEVIRYVVVHELAHLKEMNHSKKFWKLVEAMDPDYKEHIIWLRKHASLSYIL